MNMDAKQLQLLTVWVSVGLKVLSARLVLMLALFMAFGLFCWAMWNANYFTIGCAAAFAVLVYLPIIKMDGKQSAGRSIVDPQGAQNE